MSILLAQADLFSADFVTQIGVPSFIALIVSITVFFAVRAWANRDKTDAETQSAVTKLVPTLASQIGELQAEINRMHGQMSEQQQRNAEEREKRIRLEEEYKRNKEVGDIKLQQMDSTLKHHQREIAMLKQDKQNLTQERDRYRTERDKLALQVVEQNERITKQSVQIEILSKQNEEYKVWQQKEKTQPIPDLPEVEDATVSADGTLMTPVVEKLIPPDTAIPSGETTDSKQDDNDKTDMEKAS